jgi:hypothetical protein
MKSKNALFSPYRFVAGLLGCLLVGSVTFSLTAYGTKAFFPYFFVVFAVAAFLALFVLVPITLALMKLQRNTVVVTPVCMGLVTMLIFCAWNYVALAGASRIVIGGQVLVDDGVILASGFAAIAWDSLWTSLTASFSSLVFWLIAFGGIDLAVEK